MKYSSIQVTKDFLKNIHMFCAERGEKIAPMVQTAVLQYMTSSISGSSVI